MTIEQYVSTQVFEKRLEQRVLVVYDYEGLYHDICLLMASGTVSVVDTSNSSIESRELALETLAPEFDTF